MTDGERVYNFVRPWMSSIFLVDVPNVAGTRPPGGAAALDAWLDVHRSSQAATRLWYDSDVSSDTKWIIGTVIGAVVAMTGVVVSVMAILIGGVNARIDRLETDVRSMDDRLRAVEIAFGKVDQRLETLERAILPAASPPAD